MSISKEDQERITSAIRSAEAKTSGEIVCVLAQTSSTVTALPVFIAAVAALAMPWLLMAFTMLTSTFFMTRISSFSRLRSLAMTFRWRLFRT